MAQHAQRSKKHAAARGALRRRVMKWYEQFNRGHWNDCFALVDPRLSGANKVSSAAYAESLLRFKQRYGAINPWHVRISMHLDGRPVTDPRPFAYVYVVWQDNRH